MKPAGSQTRLVAAIALLAGCAPQAVPERAGSRDAGATPSAADARQPGRDSGSGETDAGGEGAIPAAVDAATDARIGDTDTGEPARDSGEGRDAAPQLEDAGGGRDVDEAPDAATGHDAEDARDPPDLGPPACIRGEPVAGTAHPPTWRGAGVIECCVTVRQQLLGTGFPHEEFGWRSAYSMELGASVGGVGDMDGDGVGDFVVGAPQGGDGIFYEGAEVGEEAHFDGAIYLVSGATGEVLDSLTAHDRPFFSGFGTYVAGPGDLDGDGVPEVLTQGVAADQVWVRWSGAPGVLERFDTDREDTGLLDGWITDINGDGAPELLFRNWRVPTTVISSGRTGETLREMPFHGPVAQGSNASFDVDDDGRPDLLLLTPEVLVPVAVDAETGEILRSYRADIDAAEPRFIGDLDGDGIDDVVVRDRREFDRRYHFFSGRTGDHHFDVLLEGDRPFEQPGPIPHTDADGDGLADWISVYRSRLMIHSGVTGEALCVAVRPLPFAVPEVPEDAGDFAHLGDIDRDGTPEYVISRGSISPNLDVDGDGCPDRAQYVGPDEFVPAINRGDPRGRRGADSVILFSFGRCPEEPE